MTRLIEICILVIVLQCCEVIYPKPIFEGISIERKLDIGFKPLKFKPLTFVREKWGPFGWFGKKHSIERRDLDEMNIIDQEEKIKPIADDAERTIPVEEKLEEPPKPEITVPLYRAPVQAVVPPNNASPPRGLNTNISPSISNNPFFTPANPYFGGGERLGPVPVIETRPIEGPFIVPVRNIPVAQNSPPPPQVPANPPRTGILSFFREFFSEIMAQLIARARASISQLGTPPVQQ